MRMSGYQDRQHFLWRHCQRSQDGEIAVLGKGDAVIETIRSKAVQWAAEMNYDDYFDVKSRLDYEKGFQAILREQDEKARTLNKLSSELLEQSQKVEQETELTRNLLKESLSANESLNRKNRALEDRFLCIICRANNINVSFIPCGHTVCCHLCYSQLADQDNDFKQCPSCRGNIVAVHQVFFS
eukprot:Skav222839  [mRNA]  locus=scaffold1338:167861:168412:- [translate_table: standard]